MTSSTPSVPCRQNPRSRNTESGDTMRRSFGGNPFPTRRPGIIAHHRGFHNPGPTPANSPSDFSGRNSTDRESNRLEFGDKENEKDQFTNMTRAPPTPKVAKNFMSPTISAASKINSSPRKKVLTERNEGPRSSVSCSDVRGLILEESKNQTAPSTVSFSDFVSVMGEDREAPTPEMSLDEKPQFADPYDMTVTDLDQKEDLELKISDVILHEKRSTADVDPSFKISPRPTVSYTSPVVTPLDSDPLMPPYDPKKNYLSPRPQFLHYRPNPRVEHFFDECKQLEDIFTSESSNTDASKDERSSENSEELEDVAWQEVESVVEEENLAAEIDDDDDVDEEMEAQGAEEMMLVREEIIETKPRRFLALKFLGCLMVLALVYFSVSASFSPRSQLYDLQNLGRYDFYIPPEFKESAIANFEQLSEKLRMWSESSCAYISKLISSLDEEQEQGWLQFGNLTDLLEGSFLDTVFQPAIAEIRVAESDHLAKKSVEKADFDNDFEAVSSEDFEAVSEFTDTNAETIEFHEETKAKTRKHDQDKMSTTDSVDTYQDGQAFEVFVHDNNFEACLEDSGQEEIQEIERNSEGKREYWEGDANTEAHELQEGLESATRKIEAEKIGGTYEDEQEEVTEEQVKHADTSKFDTEVKGLSIQVPDDVGRIAETAMVDISTETTEAQVDSRPEIGSSLEVNDNLEESPIEVSQISLGKFSMNQILLVLSSTLVVVLATSAFFFTNKAKPVMPNAAASASEPISVTDEAVESLDKERLSLLKFQTEVDDRMRESCPTEMSGSFEERNSSFYSNKDLEEPMEAQSSGARKSSMKNSSTSRNLRRESLASSASEYSIDSTSYGSFTTYERMPFKSGVGDEEGITPVRRSSRLRNQHSGI